MILWQKNKRLDWKKLCLASVIMLQSFSLGIKAMDNAKAEEKLNYLEGKAECVMELNSRRILYEANGETRLPIASTTKILTAATVLEYCNDIRAEISIPPEAVGIEGSSVYLKEGEI